MHLCFFGAPEGTPPFTFANVRTTNGVVSHPFLIPHSWFQSLFKASVRGAEGEAYEFWNSQRDTPFVQQHPLLHTRDWHKTVPLGLHGDAGSFNKQESVYLFSWNSLLGTGTTLSKRFIFTVIRKSECTPQTVDDIMKVFAWSMNVLASGVTPEEHWEGEPMEGTRGYLVAGWKGILAQIRGDWQFYCELFKFPQWNCADNMCFMCGASSIIMALLFSNCTKNAGWRGTRRTHES